MIYISISVISARSISSIFIHITYYLFLSCFICSPSHKIRNKPLEVPIATLDVVIQYTVFVTIQVNCWEYRYTIPKDKCSILQLWLLFLINLTNFYTYTYYYFSYVWIYFQYKKSETRQYKYNHSYPLQAPKCRAIWGSSRSLRERLVFCWNSTGTQITKLIRYMTQPVLAWGLVLARGIEKNLSVTSLWQAHVYSYPH